jgi:hypothetical protein
MTNQDGYAHGSDLDLEARQDEAEDLKLEARRDGVKDVEREAKIDQLESIGDLVGEALPIGAFRGERKTPDRKINPVRIDKSWHVKTERTQRRILQKKIGSYRPEPDDPVNQKPPGKSVAEGSLFDLHPLSRVRKRDVEATSVIRAAVPAPLPVKPVSPGPAEEPIPGRCLECYTPLRKRDRAGTKFCTDNMGECRKAYNSREADRAARNEIFKEWSDRRHGERMFSIHCRAADAMYFSAIRCGINVTFTADDDGVLAVHTQPLPPFGPKCCVSVEDGDGYRFHDVEIVATPADAGTLYAVEMKARPEGNAQVFQLSFEGDPGPEWTGEALPTRAPPLPPGAAMYAARNGRVAEYIAACKASVLVRGRSV